MIELAAPFAFVALLAFAAGCDIATMTIPNWLSIALAALFPVVAAISGAPLAEIGAHVGFGAAVLFAGFVLFSLGVLGGGDAKLIGAAAVWTGAAAFLDFVTAMALAGGALAIALFIARRFVSPAEHRPAFANRLLRARGGIPYGVAILVGGFAVVDAMSIAPAH